MGLAEDNQNFLLMYSISVNVSGQIASVIAGMVAPASVALVGFLMFGNLLRECGVLNALSETEMCIRDSCVKKMLYAPKASACDIDRFHLDFPLPVDHISALLL